MARSGRPILTGKLGPSSSIDKAALCEQLGVSRFPVAAAINRLAFERLVVVQPQDGSFVAKIVLKDVAPSKPTSRRKGRPGNRPACSPP
ncbi:GntR family transcriptional regulator [Mesorhizobium sp.]|uniref:GntR family transcriptional regulator n=1 Tax=Mesorhizobium sp. TaxID=1871066 RepID=UPI000FEAA19E|nr:MAG: GntR family transcriptional regulator [Mesorhizobium sp.]